jgi:AmmeMemoRadiSam system protein B/AmmeMemoRadiSam system protein A
MDHPSRLARPSRFRASATLLWTLALLGCHGGGALRAGEEVRPAAQAGRFYPAEATKLAAAVEGFLADAVPVRVPEPIALVVPHAGYVFSGQIAADGFRQAADRTYETIVVLGTNHTTPGFDKVGLTDVAGFHTPLGTLAVDTALVRALLAECRDCVLNREVHAQEHSIEVQLPFIQKLFPQATLLALVVGSEDVALAQRVGAALAKVVAGRKVLLVASSDLSHYPRAEDGEAPDRAVLDAVASLDLDKVRATTRAWMRRGIPQLSTCACGEAPILVALAAAKALGAKNGVVLSRTNSGRGLVSGEERTVGYGAVAFTAGAVLPGAIDEPGRVRPGTRERIGADDRRVLLALARKAIQRRLTTDTVPLPRGLSARGWQRQGAFVTLKKHGDLRGCIGRIPPEVPLGQLVGAMALAAAFEDPRFRPLALDELSAVTIEISALTPPVRVPRADDIVVGRHGVLLRKGSSGAVFLPQVATEQGWDRNQLLDHLCEKGGMSAGCWKSGAELSVFEAEVFHEGQ